MSTAYGQNVGHEPEGVQALPGGYQVRLTADCKAYTQKFSLKMDPRVKIAILDLQKQFDLEVKLLSALQRGDQALGEIQRVRRKKQTAREVESALAEIEPAGTTTPRRPRSKTSLSGVNGALLQLSTGIAGADAAPTTQQTSAAQKAFSQLDALIKQWDAVKAKVPAETK